MKRALTITVLTTLISSLLFLVPSSTAENLPTFKPIARGALAQDSVYFVMTDRFANGNPQNDGAFVKGGPLVNGLDKTDIGYWHGGDFAGLTEKLPYIKKLGFFYLDNAPGSTKLGTTRFCCIPRLLGNRFHDRRPTLRYRSRIQIYDCKSSCVRNESDCRHRRQPHCGHHL